MDKQEIAFFEEQYNSVIASRDKLFMRAGICLGITGVFLLLTLLNLPRIAMGILQLIFSIFIWVVCNSEMIDGLRSFFKLRPSNDSFNALALIGSMVHSIYMLAANPPADEHFFGVALYAAITLSIAMKYLYVGQIIKNLDLIRDKKTYALQVTDLSLSKKYIRQICSANPMEEFPNVVRASYNSDPTEKKNRSFVPLVTIGVIVASTFIGIVHRGSFFVSLFAMLCICACFSAEMSFVLPYIMMQIRLRKLGSILMGNYSIEHLKETDALLIQDKDLFPPENNEILKLNIHNKAKTKEAILYIASLLNRSESPLEEAFHKKFQGIPAQLPTVLQWRVVKSHGIIANINVDNVLLGNRNLLLSHNIQPWSPEKEAMLTAAGVHLVYLTINGKIAATLICRYGEDPELKKSAELLGGDFHLLVETKDCNINESMIQRKYDLSHTKISVPDPDEAKSVVETREELEEDQSPPVIISTQNALGILESIRRAKKLHSTLNLCITLQQLSILFGLILTAIGILIAPGNVSWLWVFAFNLIWALPAVAIALFQKE